MDINSTKLREIIEDSVNTVEEQMLYKDFFAFACGFSKEGKDDLAGKALTTLFKALGYEGRKTYFLNLQENLKGNEDKLLIDIWAHSEMEQLLDRPPRALSDLT